MVRMLRLTDAFIWEDLPTTDPVTGSLTMASWIPRIQKFKTIITTTVTAFNFAQITIRFTISDDRPFTYGNIGNMVSFRCHKEPDIRADQHITGKTVCYQVGLKLCALHCVTGIQTRHSD